MGIISIFGMIVCFGAIIIGVIFLGGDLMAFASIPSVLLVVVPTIGALATTVPVGLIAKIPSHFKVILRKEKKPEAIIEKIVELANKVRSGGILALEEEVIDEPTMQYGVRMLVDSVNENEIKNALDESLDSITARHNEAVLMYDKGANSAPAFGMCATVVSLVNMLNGLDFADPEAVGKLGINMSAALITTLYGSMVANIIFIPLSSRLKLLHKREMFNKSLICTGIMAIQHGNTPTFIYELLCEQLNKEKRKNVKNTKGRGAEE
jgi:chemotaxis protein MotA